MMVLGRPTRTRGISAYLIHLGATPLLVAYQTYARALPRRANRKLPCATVSTIVTAA
jgi:hypothetical protein